MRPENALVVKWISRLASNQLLGVRITPGAHIPYLILDSLKGVILYPGWDSNPQAFRARDFKSLAYTVPPPGRYERV